MCGDKIPKDHAEELADCFVTYAQGLFGYACVLTRADRALADDLVQSTFEAAAAHWPTVRCLRDPQRLRWLRTTIGNLAIGVALATAMRADVIPSGSDAETLVAGRVATAIGVEVAADEALTELYSNHYRSLVRLAGLLVRDDPTAEEIVQECFIAMHGGWHRLRDEDKALSYLKKAVVNRSRSVLRHRSVMDRNAPKPAPDMPSAEQGTIAQLERSAVIAALQALPDRQRQALVLRYYADLSETQIAKIMGISKGAVKSHTARGMSSLRAVLEQTT